MRILVGLLVALSLSPASATHTDPVVWAEGHITAGGRWADVRSTSVVADRDSVDGFFFRAPLPGAELSAEVIWNGTCALPSCRPYRLSLNFHDDTNTIEDDYLGIEAGPRTWITGCGASANQSIPKCTVPDGAVTGEVAAADGIDLVVIVMCRDPRHLGACADPPYQA